MICPANSRLTLAAIAAMRGAWDEAEERGKIARRLDANSMSHHYVRIIKMLREGDPGRAGELVGRILAEKPAPGGGSLLDMLVRVSRRKNS